MPYPSFDSIMASGCVPEACDWILDDALTITSQDIRLWRGDLGCGAADSDLHVKAQQRRTNLWRMVLANDRLYWRDSMASDYRTPLRREPHYHTHTLPTLASTAQTHLHPFAITPSLADTLAHGPSEILTHLNTIFRTEVTLTPDLEAFLQEWRAMHLDFGQIYSWLRPWWPELASGNLLYVREMMHSRRLLDAELRCPAQGSDWGLEPWRLYAHRATIYNVELPPRRVWDLYSNRVVPYHVIPSFDIPDNLWAVSHAWVRATDREDVWTSINGFQWAVPVPKGVDLENVRTELLNMGAEYVFLDILCLRQGGDVANEALRAEEWKIDIPTLGHVYRHDPFQTTIIYFNGLGRPLDIARDLVDSPLHWFNRPWTLQETVVNWLPGGLTPGLLNQLKHGPHFMQRMQSAQGVLATPSQKQPRFDSLLNALRRRRGFAAKKPYDRVAALAYILPYPTRLMYDEGWESAENAWGALVESMSGKDRLALLLFPRVERVLIRPGKSENDSTSSRLALWRPTWAQLMLQGKNRLPTAFSTIVSDSELIMGPYLSCPPQIVREKSSRRKGRSRKGEADNTPAGMGIYKIHTVYHHTATVLTNCRASGDGRVIVQNCQRQRNIALADMTNQKSYDEPFQLETPVDLPMDMDLVLVGFADLQHWIVGTSDETIVVNNAVALVVNKLTVGCMTDPAERERLRKLDLGRRRTVAYREPAVEVTFPLSPDVSAAASKPVTRHPDEEVGRWLMNYR